MGLDSGSTSANFVLNVFQKKSSLGTPLIQLKSVPLRLSSDKVGFHIHVELGE